jgi:hypothetical protein
MTQNVKEDDVLPYAMLYVAFDCSDATKADLERVRQLVPDGKWAQLVYHIYTVTIPALNATPIMKLIRDQECVIEVKILRRVKKP